MLAPVLALAIFIAVFAVATVRKVHLGVLMFPAACAVGVLLAGMPLREVVAGFPVGIMVLLAGVTYFFGIAQVNGTVDRLIATAVLRAGTRPVTLPFVFFALTGGVAAMGSPQGGLVMAPVGMPVARRCGLHPAVMGVAINSGISAGGYAPTSLFGIVSYRVAREAGIDLSPYTLLGIAIIANLVLVIAALFIFGNLRQTVAAAGQDCLPQVTLGNGPGDSSPGKLRRHQIATMVCMVGLVASVIACAVQGVDPDVGVIAFAFGAVLTLMDPTVGARAFTKIDWSTIFMVGGIVTFVGVLQKLGSVNLLGHAAMDVGTPLIAAVLICAIAGLASAFASTTGILAALVPMAVPLAASGQIAGWALICALSVCASIVDVSPFSTTGATLVATAAEDERSRLRVLLTRWGMSMVVVGPLVLVPLLMILSSL